MKNLNKGSKGLSDVDNRTVYKKMYNRIVSSCPICAPHKGCNRGHRQRDRSWKRFRKTKYKF